jgi:hypothetical protein
MDGKHQAVCKLLKGGPRRRRRRALHLSGTHRLLALEVVHLRRAMLELHYAVRPRHSADRHKAGRALPPLFCGDTGCQNTNVPVSGMPPVAQYCRFSRAAQGGGISRPYCICKCDHLSVCCAAAHRARARRTGRPKRTVSCVRHQLTPPPRQRAAPAAQARMTACGSSSAVAAAASGSGGWRRRRRQRRWIGGGAGKWDSVGGDGGGDMLLEERCCT